MCLTAWHLLTHQSHDVVGQVTSQVRGHETRKASKGNACVILVRTAEVLEDTIQRMTSHLRSGNMKNAMNILYQQISTQQS